MTKLILVSALLFAFSCKSGMVGKSDVDIQAVEASPCWSEKEAVEQLEAMLALQPGETSAPVKTKFGYHLVRLQEIKGEQYRSSHILLRPCE